MWCGYPGFDDNKRIGDVFSRFCTFLHLNKMNSMETSVAFTLSDSFQQEKRCRSVCRSSPSPRLLLPFLVCISSQSVLESKKSRLLQEAEKNICHLLQFRVPYWEDFLGVTPYLQAQKTTTFIFAPPWDVAESQALLCSRWQMSAYICLTPITNLMLFPSLRSCLPGALSLCNVLIPAEKLLGQMCSAISIMEGKRGRV